MTSMNKISARLKGAFLALALLASCSLFAGRAQADAPNPTNTATYASTGVALGFAPIISCGGASTLSIVTSGGSTGYTLIPYTSSDGKNWTVASTVNSGTVGADGTVSGAIVAPGQGINYGTYAVTVAPTGSLTVTETCSAGLAFFSTPPPTTGPSSTPNGFVVAFATPPAAPGQQHNANISIDGVIQFGTVSSTGPAPTVSQSPGAFIYDNGVFVGFANTLDSGTTSGNKFRWLANNQGAWTQVLQLNESGLSGADMSFTSQAIGAPPTPIPSCAPGGTNAPTSYFVKTSYGPFSNNNSASVVSGESAQVNCGLDTFLLVIAPPPAAGAAIYHVYATTGASGTETLQTGGTPAGPNIALTSSWNAGATLVGAATPPPGDSTLGTGVFGGLTFGQTFVGTTTTLSTTTATGCGGQSGTLFSFGNGGVKFTADTTGNTAVCGTIKAAAQANSSTTTSYVPPVYTSAGAVVASTYHGVQGTCTFSTSTCTPSAFTNGAVFASTTSIDGCSWKLNAVATAVAIDVEQTSATQIVFNSLSTLNGDVLTFVCWGA